jgi:uncharacterized protein YfaS (alpha-2-macroglobulin family)
MFSSCSQKKELLPATDFMPYIAAYTGSKISMGSAIMIEFKDEIPEKVRTKAAGKKLFSFTPALKGTAEWIDGKTVVFTPEPEAMKTGATYQAIFALGKVMTVDSKFSNFAFSFCMEQLSFSLTTVPIEIREDNAVTVSGYCSFNVEMKPEVVQKMLTASLDGKKATITIVDQSPCTFFHFMVKDIPRKGTEQRLLITLDGAQANDGDKKTATVKIPAKDIFRLSDYKVLSSPEYSLYLTFSDFVSESQNLNSMITLKNVANYTTQVRGNQVIVHFTPLAKTRELAVTVDGNLKNQKGEVLESPEEFNFTLERPKPKVEILTNGTIMPNAGNILLPFRTIGLYAVDLKIVRIFESNLLMFLQTNTLSQKSSNQLRRAGRLVYKQTLRLDTDSKRDILAWENFSLNLSKLVKQQPGAIYRVVLSFKQAYTSCGCDDEEEKVKALHDAISLQRLQTQEEAVAEDDEYWDRPSNYYYDWDDYDWWEQFNPCEAKYDYGEITTASNVLVSDLGIIAKSNPNHTVWVAVSNLLDTEAVADARVTAYNYQLQPLGNGLTDEDGFTVLSLKNKPFIIVAEAGRQKAYLRMADSDENMLSRFDVGGVELKKGLKGYIYGERGVWRPGDTLHLAFMLEDRDKIIPANHPVSFEVYNPQGQFYKKMTSNNGLNGLYSFKLPTQADDPTGLWDAYVKVGGVTFHKSLRIETVKPNRFKINLNLPDIIETSKGTAQVGIHAQWLTGAVARNPAASMELVLSKMATPFKAYEKFSFNNPLSKFSSGSTDVFNGKLDENGDSTLNMRIPLAEHAPGLLNATLICRVYEPGGDASIFSRAVPFSPYPAYVGINFNQRSNQNYLFVDEDCLFDIVTLGADGQPVNCNDLEYKIYRIGWSWWWEQSNKSDETSTFETYINNSSYTPEFTGKLSTENGKGQIRFRLNYPDWGRFLVYVKDMSGGHATGGTILVDWPSWRGRSNKSDPSGIKMLTFSLDKNKYQVGEEVIVTIPAVASGGHALAAFENGSEVLHREWVSLNKGRATKYTFKVTEKMAPNIYLHLSLLQPFAATADLPIRMYGIMPVFVENKASRLTPVITMPDVLKPETGFEVKVKEQNGKPMTYTLAIVDEGLLDLSNFKTPNPWNDFYAREALGIRTYDIYDYVMSAYAGKLGALLSVGGDGELNKSSAKANRFKPVVMYAGPFALKTGEEKKHTLHLPAYIGSVRVMVVAGQAGAYGNAEKTVSVRAPLMALSSLPRVLSTGEKIALPVNVFAMDEQVQHVTIRVETTGKLKATKENTKSVTFNAPGDEMVYFDMQTGEETGVDTVTITVSGGGHTTKETIEIDIRNPNPPTIRYESKLLEKGQSVEFEYTLTSKYEGNWVKAEMSRIPSVDLSRRFDYLSDYKHYCTEQLTSRALPLLFLQEFKELDSREAAQTKKSITEAINSLYRRQLPNGGFCYWEGQEAVNDWVTSYAGSFLVMAKERGYQVNTDVVNKWIAYQRNKAQQWRANDHTDNRYTYQQSDFLQAYRLYTLALAGATEMAAMNRLKEVSALSMQAKWRLAAAYAICGKQDAANELILNISTSIEAYSTHNPTFGSFDRDEAMILETLVLMGKNEEAFKQAQKVAKNLSDERFFNTQSTAYAMVAMGQFAKKTAGAFEFDWYVNEQKQNKVDSRKAVYQQQLPTNPLSGKVKVENNSDGVLYFSLATKTRPVVDRLPAVSEGLKLNVSYTDMKRLPVDVTDLQQGTDFYAVVTVSNISSTTDYTDVALTHIIPSGWEIFNDRMVAASASESGRQAANAKEEFAYQDIRDDCILTYFDLPAGSSKEIKIRLQASYTGDFVLPAILCEAMYDPSARARSTAGRVKVYK